MLKALHFFLSLGLINMSEPELRSQLDIKELQLNALLEITQSINNNVPEDSLYKIFNFTLRSNLNINKLALFVLDEVWNCKVNFGTQKRFQKLKLDDRFTLIKNVHRMDEFDECEFDEFDLVIPVSHKTDTLALVFVGGLTSNLNNERDDSIKFIQALSNIIIRAAGIPLPLTSATQIRN